jgi:hypothetical protein
VSVKLGWASASIPRSDHGVHRRDGPRSRVWAGRGPIIVLVVFQCMRSSGQSYVVAVPVSTSTRGAVLALGGTKVFARSRGPRASTPRLLDAERPTLVNLALEGILGGVRVLGSDHLDESEATALAGVWVTHDVALLDPSVLLEEDSDLFLGQARVDAGDEEVGALVDVAGVAATRATTLSAIAVAAAVLARRGNVTGGMSVGCCMELMRSKVLTARHGRCRSRRECECRHRGRRQESESANGRRRAGTLVRS